MSPLRAVGSTVLFILALPFLLLLLIIVMLGAPTKDRPN